MDRQLADGNDRDPVPLETRGVVPSSPGLYLAGLAFQYAFASMLVGGAGRDAGYVVRHLCARPRRAGHRSGPRERPDPGHR